jgi:hypothetical protein
LLTGPISPSEKSTAHTEVGVLASVVLVQKVLLNEAGTEFRKNRLLIAGPVSERVTKVSSSARVGNRQLG